jgi:signal transduction histidine kinase
MLKNVLKLFRPPVFPHDENKTRSALLLNVVVNTFLVVLPVLFAYSILQGAIPRQEVTLITLTAAWFMSIGIRFILATGRIKLAGIMIVAVLFAGTTLNIYAIGTIQTSATSLYFLIVVITGLILGSRAIIWVTGICGVTILSLSLAEIKGYLPSPALKIDLVQNIAFVVSFAVVSILLYIAVRNMDESLVRVQRELVERKQAEKREQDRRKSMETVIRIAKNVTEVTDLRTTLWRIWDGIKNGLDFDRVGLFLYNALNETMEGSYGTDRSGKLTEEWDIKFKIDDANSVFHKLLHQPNGYYLTKDYEAERNLKPGHRMAGVKYYANVAVWAGDTPVAIICVDQLTSGRAISEEQVETLRLFAGYAGLAIENARLNSELKKRLEEREQFIQKLETNNAELERFTYTVSHDLRSPIVTIKGFLGFLEKDIKDNFQEKIQVDIRRIENATDKMNTLLSDLLELSRIGRIINPPIAVDLLKLTQEALETTDGRIRAKNIAVRIAPGLPVLYGDRVRLREVMENLIDNAAKYMGNQPDPVIEIGARSQPGDCVVFVKDNGMGIEPQYLTKIFGLFEKLTPTSEGTGIGLALIKRIIEVHGGRIWAESEGLGKGSVFCFTIPKGNPADGTK